MRCIDCVVDSMTSAAARLDKVMATDAKGADKLDLTKWDFTEGVFISGVRPLLSNLEDPVLSIRAGSNTRKYLGAYQRWKSWADTS